LSLHLLQHLVHVKSGGDYLADGGPTHQRLNARGAATLRLNDAEGEDQRRPVAGVAVSDRPDLVAYPHDHTAHITKMLTMIAVNATIPTIS
jgi:hypothetical protein